MSDHWPAVSQNPVSSVQPEFLPSSWCFLLVTFYPLTPTLLLWAQSLPSMTNPILVASLARIIEWFFPISPSQIPSAQSFCVTLAAQPGALWQPRGLGWGGRFRREGTYASLWLIHVAAWQKPTHHHKAIILQLKINFKIFPLAKRKVEEVISPL